MSDTVCVLPWMHITTNTQGQVGPCCIFDTNHELTNLKTHTLKEAVNCSGMKQLRLDMIQGRKSPVCRKCWHQEDQGLWSLRQHFNQVYGKYLPLVKNTQADGTVEDFRLRMAEVRVSNLCNLKCRMCSGALSSSIAQEDATLYNNRHFIDIKITNEESAAVMSFLSEQIDYIEFLYFGGGEPLLLESHYEFLELIINKGRTDIRLDYNTNLTNLKFKNKHIVDYWKQFSNVNIGISLDATDGRAAYIRHGSDYQKIKNNYYEIAPYVNVDITSTLSLYNVFNLTELQRDWIVNEKLSASRIDMSVLTDPNILSIQVLPYEVKQQALTHINNHINWLNSIPNSENLVQKWKLAQSHMMNRDQSHLLADFFEVNDTRDRYRNESFETTFPEFQNLRSISNYAIQ